MPSMDVVFSQIVVILLYVGIGYVAGKVKLIGPDQRKFLTRICTDLILPFTVLSSASLSLDKRQMAVLGASGLLVFCIYLGTTILSLAFLSLRHVPAPVKVTTTSLVTYPNCTFLGLPLCTALFGERAILFNAVCLLVFNLLFFGCQYSLFTGKRFQAKNLLTPPTVATGILVFMLGLDLHFPSPVQQVVAGTGQMITPLSLIIIGVMMSENKLLAILKEKKSYLVCLVRNILIPLLSMALLNLLSLPPEDKLCLLVYISCPCATLSTIYAIQSDMEPEYAAHSVLMSTLFFALTLPVMIAVGGRMFL
ncbi:MAG: AEC family transporter [Blautia sp.]|nr:AEC family transporter [Blautia sp.]